MIFEFAKQVDGLVAAFAFVAGITYAIEGTWHKAIFFMILATNCELGYWMGK
ncbi:MAG: hypothetical protein LUC93_05590 [Planctomycetaceae bacterium]|nr:hypothetical protein [Planctomycetaceae bacterium]